MNRLTFLHRGRDVSEVRLDGEPLPMTPLERQFLGALALRPGEMVLRTDLALALRVGPFVLNNTVCRLRKSLPDARWVRSAGNRKARQGFGYYLRGVRVEWRETVRLPDSEACYSTVIESGSAGSPLLVTSR